MTGEADKITWGSALAGIKQVTEVAGGRNLNAPLEQLAQTNPSFKNLQQPNQHQQSTGWTIG